MKTKEGDIVLNPKPLTDWFCSTFQFKDLENFDPFFKHPVHAWMPGKEVYITAHCGSQNLEQDIVTIDTQKEQEEQKLCCVLGDTNRCSIDHAPASLFPRKPFLNPSTKEPLRPDLDKVAIFSVVARHAINTLPRQMATRINFDHKYLSTAQGTKEQDELFASWGAPKGAFFAIPPSTSKKGIDVTSFAIRTMDHHYTNIEFVRTMAHVNESNLLNGIVHIPPAICDASGLRIYKGIPLPDNAGPDFDYKAYEQHVLQEYEKTHGYKPTHHWVAVPCKHVLAWPWCTNPLARQEAFPYKVVDFPEYNPSKQLYFLVENVVFEQHVNSFKKFWLNKVEFYSLKDIGIEFIPMLNVVEKKAQEQKEQQIVSGVVQTTLYIAYMTFPQMTPSIISSLAPTRSANFPLFEKWMALRTAQQNAKFFSK